MWMQFQHYKWAIFKKDMFIVLVTADKRGTTRNTGILLFFKYILVGTS